MEYDFNEDLKNRISDNIAAVKESIDDSALAEKYDKEYKRNNM